MAVTKRHLLVVIFVTSTATLVLELISTTFVHSNANFLQDSYPSGINSLQSEKPFRIVNKMIDENLCNSSRYNMEDTFTLKLNYTKPYFNEQLCNDITDDLKHKSKVFKSKSDSILRDTLLIVAFNHDTNYQSIPLIHILYRRTFGSIRYCGPTKNRKAFEVKISRYFPKSVAQSFSAMYLSYGSLLKDEVMHGYGETVYFCINLVLSDVEMKSNLKGILFIHDDVLVNFWLLESQHDIQTKSYSYPLWRPFNIFSHKLCSFSSSEQAAKRNLCDVPWIWYPLTPYAKAVEAFYDEMVQLDEMTFKNSTEEYLVQSCYRSILNQSRGPHRLFAGESDSFYLTRRHFSMAKAFFNLAQRHGLFQEIAVPSLFACLNQSERGVFDRSSVLDWEHLVNTKEHDGYGDQNIDFYNPDVLTIHPFKLGSLVMSVWGTRLQIRLLANKTCLYCAIRNVAVNTSN